MSKPDLLEDSYSTAQVLGEKQPHFERVLFTEEAAALLGIHPKTLQRLARDRQVPGFRIGKLWAFRASALDGWLNSKVAS